VYQRDAAFSLIVMLEEKGIVGPPVEIGPREILIDLETA
jgi:DNA segregation ATPase FtsK/SpoIIIE-like protein